MNQLNRDFLQHMLAADLEACDPLVADLVDRETTSQIEQLILVPSVSAAPAAVLQALGSVFQNVCAEGQPAARMLRGDEADLAQIAWQMANTRRYADRRFYKGVGYVDLIESVAQQRAAALFANAAVPAGDLFANVQALSGGTANLAIYYALLNPGDTVLGMSLTIGGHLSHGARVNLSGQYYNFVPFGVAPETEQLDYDQVRALAQKHRPRLIVAGFTSYPWAPDWQKFRQIADEVGAYLLADIAHTAGLVAAGAMSSPVGVADVISLTTNKTLCGPRSAIVLTTEPELADAIDRAIFPGLQGAPHPNKFAAVAVTLKLAQEPAFQQMQHQIVANARALAHGLSARGVRLAYGGTDTHLLVVDLKPFGRGRLAPLYGETAARILEQAGLIVNRNTVPGDTDSALATGIRLGTPWLTQRGLVEADMDRLADLISSLLADIHPFTYASSKRPLPRGKVSLAVLREVRAGVRQLAQQAPAAAGETGRQPAPLATGLHASGPRVRQFLQQATTADIVNLAAGALAPAYILDGDGGLISPVVISANEEGYRLFLPPTRSAAAHEWLSGLSDGYIRFDADIYRKVQGPVTLTPLFTEVNLPPALAAHLERTEVDTLPANAATKLFFVGQPEVSAAPAGSRPVWSYTPVAQPTLQTTPLLAEHQALDARLVPFAGWQMPLRYGSVVAEHNAVRQAAGLFDISHMGIIEVTGPQAVIFLDTVFSNYAAWLDDRHACYGLILDPAGNVIDDAVVYRLHSDRFLLVVNAANELKVWDWLQSVNEQAVMIDQKRPGVRLPAPAQLRRLRSESAGAAALALLALQGQSALPTLQALAGTAALGPQLRRLPRNRLIAGRLAGHEVYVARTGYTGEAVGFEIFVPAAGAAALWRALLAAGAEHGVLPVGLGARDSLRTEAGLPLWGHELAGPAAISPLEAGLAPFVKFHKPFFVGRDALLAQSRQSERRIVPFTVDQLRSRVAKPGDPIHNQQGETVGQVTSCAMDGTRRLLGLALIAQPAYQAAGTALAYLPLGGASPEDSPGPQERATTPVPMTIGSRYE